MPEKNLTLTKIKVADQLQKAKSELFSNPDQSLALCKDALTILDETDGLISQKIRIIQIKGQAFRILGQYNKAVTAIEESILLAAKYDEVDLNALGYLELAGIYLKESKTKDAIKLLLKAQTLSSNLPQDKVNNFTGVALFLDGMYSEAIVYFKNTVELLSKEKDIAPKYLNLGNCYEKLGDIDRALDYHNKALELASKFNLKRVEVSAYNNIGICHQKRLEFIEAIKAFRLGAEIAKEKGFSHSYCNVSNSLGRVFQQQKDYAKAIPQFSQVIIDSREGGYLKYEVEALGSIAECYFQIGNFERAYLVQKKLTKFQSQKIKTLESTTTEQKLINKEQQIKLLKNSSETIAIQNSQLEQQNEDLRQFAFVVAHDLKEPIRTLGSFTNLLQRRFPNDFDDEAKKFMEFIRRGSHKINSLLNSLLQYVSIDKNDHSFETFESRHIFNEVIRQLDPLIQKHRIKVTLKGNFPIVHCNYDLILQAFQHLLANSIQFKQEIDPEITISVIQKKDLTTFLVKDNGIGIQEEYHEKIFKIFHRLNKKDDNQTGIGLAICNKIAKIHQGTLDLESTPGQGSTFFLSIKRYN